MRSARSRRAAIRRAAAAGIALAALLVTGALVTSAAAQTGLPGLLRDIATAPLPTFGPTYGERTSFVAMGGELYFASWDQTTGLELRATDGTAAGTRNVRDVCPGSCSGFSFYELVESGGVLYFGGDDGAHGFELWRSDGTRAGTRMVVEIVPGADNVAPRYLTPVPGGVYFVADDADHGWELWWSDGTAAGTHLVVDLLPGNPAGPPGARGPSHLTWLPGAGLVFAADDGVHGRELWLTQGTAATTAMLADVQPGPGSGLLHYDLQPGAIDAPAAAGGKVFFAADDGTHGRELWATDGTPAGTAQVADVDPGGADSEPNRFFPFAGGVLFSAESGWFRTLWRSDGSAAGTVPLGDLAHGTDRLDPRGAFAELGGVVYFVGNQAGTGLELWRTDGTVAGTQLAVDVWPGPQHGVLAHRSLSAAEGRLWFPATNGVHGVEWWQSDGTPGGTFEVDDLVAGADDSLFAFFAEKPAGIAGKVLFAGYDLARLWAVRSALPGVAGSTVVEAAGERPGSLPNCVVVGNCPVVITPVAGGAAFTAVDGAHGGEPWRSDGTDAGTRLVADIAPGFVFSTPSPMTLHTLAPLGDDLLIVGNDCSGGPCPDSAFQLRRADAAGVVTQLSSEPWSVAPGDLASWNGIGFFAAENGVWSSDGTPPGTGLLASAAVGARWFTAAAESLYFVAGGLWKTDGTAAGTVPVAAALSFYPQRPLLATVAGKEVLYFAAADAAAGNELWTSDGSDGGTRRVVDLRSGPASGIAIVDQPGFDDERQSLLAASGPLVFFAGDDGAAGEELWVSDGSPGNATLLEVRPGPAGSMPRWVTAAGGRVYFAADDGVSGREPWVTDGTVAGTHLVADVRPGPESSTPGELVAWMGRLVFAADDDVHGMELWRAAIGGAGAELVTDLSPGVEPSSPQGLTAIGERLFFYADDGATGLEPWVWSAAADLFADGFETGNVGRWSRATPP